MASTEYVEWFLPFAEQFSRVLKPAGSLVIDLGGTWVKGEPVRSLYHYEFLLRLCRPQAEGGFGFHLAQELYWYNPAKLPTPAQWVTIERTRVKDAVNTVWWLSPTTRPKANNRRVLKAYSEAQRHLMKHGYDPKLRPSEHNISGQFGNDNGGAIPANVVLDSESPAQIGDDVAVGQILEGLTDATGRVPVNLVSAPNTSSNDRYQRRCREENVPRHPARFPKALPEFIIGLTTEPGDVVLDPFAGSNTTGEVAQEMGRRYLAFEVDESYLHGSRFRFPELDVPASAGDGAVEAAPTLFSGV